MAQVPDLTQIARDAKDTATAAFIALNNTEGWTIGPDGEFDGDPEEPRFAVLVFYCILVSAGMFSSVCKTKSLQASVCETIVCIGSHDMCAECPVLLEEATEAKL